MHKKRGSLSRITKMMRRRCWRLPLPCQWKSTSDRSTRLWSNQQEDVNLLASGVKVTVKNNKTVQSNLYSSPRGKREWGGYTFVIDSALRLVGWEKRRTMWFDLENVKIDWNLSGIFKERLCDYLSKDAVHHKIVIFHPYYTWTWCVHIHDKLI